MELADCGLCSRAVVNGHKAVQCDGCELWIHNECLFISEDDYENVLTTRCTWICPKCDFFNFSDSLDLIPCQRIRMLGFCQTVQKRQTLATSRLVD